MNMDVMQVMLIHLNMRNHSSDVNKQVFKPEKQQSIMKNGGNNNE
jgi:hypothetical protein